MLKGFARKSRLTLGRNVIYTVFLGKRYNLFVKNKFKMYVFVLNILLLKYIVYFEPVCRGAQGTHRFETFRLCGLFYTIV